jgi:HSP20 family protein
MAEGARRRPNGRSDQGSACWPLELPRIVPIFIGTGEGSLDPYKQEAYMAVGNIATLDELFNGFLVRPVGPESRAGQRAATFGLDVFETENAYRVVADLPGLGKDQINVTIDGPEVAISVEGRNNPVAAENEKALLSERYKGKYFRAITLAHDIDQANAQARYLDGVLELTLPKSADSMPKKIAIQ